MKRQQGVAMVEFALILPMLLILTFTVTELGRAFYQYNVLAKSVREAARYLSVRSPGTDLGLAKNIIVYGKPSGGSSPVLTGLALSNVPDPTYGSSGTFPIVN